MGFIRHRYAAQAAHVGVFVESHCIGFAVVEDGFCFAFHPLITYIALLTKKCTFAPRTGGGTKLEAFIVLPHLHAICANDHRALGDHHIAGEHAGLLHIVVTQRIGLGIHRLGTVGFFCVSGRGQEAG